MSWPVVKLGDICETTQGVQITKANTKDEPYEGGFRYLYIADFISDKKLSFVDDIFDNKKVTTNDLVMANTGSPGRVFKGKEGVLSNNLFKITFAQEGVNRDYLYLMLSSNVFQSVLQQQMKGGIQKHLGHQTISRQEIPLPPLEEQKRIAAILDKADGIRRKRQQAIDLADEFLRSVFLDMFGDPITNPKGWEVKNLGDCLDFLTSGSRGWAKYYSEKGKKFIRIMNVGKNRLLLNDIAYVNPPETKEAERTRVKEGDVMLSITADLGRSAVVTKELEGGHINQHLALLRPNSNMMNSSYLSALLSSNAALIQFTSANKAAVKAGLNFTDIREFKVLVPPIKLQSEYEQLSYQIATGLNRLKKSSEGKIDLFNSLSQKAFAGEL